MHFTNTVRDCFCTKELSIKKNNNTKTNKKPKYQGKEWKKWKQGSNCSNFNKKELCGRKVKDSPNYFSLKDKTFDNNTDLGGKMLSFDCKGTNVEPYNCVTKN